MSGCFVTFEGLDGSGKSTQARLLAGSLAESGYDPVLTREPGGTELGEAVRGLLLDLDSVNLTREAEALLYCASRAQHVAEVIQPALERGAIVISDRFSDSMLAYQGYGLRVDLEALKRADALACRGVVPDLTILLDIVPARGLARKDSSREGAASPASRDRIEGRGPGFYADVRQGYLELASAESDRIMVLRVGNAGEREIHAQVHEAVVRRLLRGGHGP